jgi:hypothetical protein
VLEQLGDVEGLQVDAVGAADRADLDGIHLDVLDRRRRDVDVVLPLAGAGGQRHEQHERESTVHHSHGHPLTFKDNRHAGQFHRRFTARP